MKVAMSMLVGLGLLLKAGGAGAEPVAVFADDVEGDTLGGDPVADIGSYSDASGRVTDLATSGIATNPSGGSQFVEIRRGLGGSDMVMGEATEVAGAGAKVHLEFDMYIAFTGEGTTYADFQLLENDELLTNPGGGHPTRGAAPFFTVIGTSPTMAEVHNMWLDAAAAWHVGPLGIMVSLDAWHRYEGDYTIGDVNSMFLTVDGGTPLNIPPPWGYDAYGDPDTDPNARNVLDETWGVMLRPGGSNPLYFADNIELTFDIPVLAFSGFEVKTSRMLEFQSESNLLYELQSALPPQTDVWAAVGLTVTGTGSNVFVFDPEEPDGSSTQKVYRALEIR